MNYNIVIYCTLFVMSLPVFGEDLKEIKRDHMQVVPILANDNLILSSQNVRSSSAGLALNSNELMLVSLFSLHHFDGPLLNAYPREYRSIDVLLDSKHARSQYLGILKSKSDQPVYGGLNTFQAGFAYGHEYLRNETSELVIGGGIAVGDFGIRTNDGKIWPVIPVPLLRWKYHSQNIEAKLEFLTNPNFSFTVSPKNRIRLSGEMRIVQMRDLRDLIFETNLMYRLFSPNHAFGDFASVSIGLKNDNSGTFYLANRARDENVEIQYFSVFGAFDLSLAKIVVGYAFGGRSRYGNTTKQDLGEGIVVSIQGMYAF